MEEFKRNIALVGQEKQTKLLSSHVCVFGVGGVGGYAIEALVRAGVGKIDIYDFDIVGKSNINRQIIALNSTVGKKKTELMIERAKDINNKIDITGFDINVNKENIEQINFDGVDYIVDCIDTITSKVLLIEKAKKFNVSIISCMGTGNKLDPKQLEIVDINKTSVCPLARVMRRLLKQKGIANVNVLYSKETPITPTIDLTENQTNKIPPASMIFVPSIAGIMLAQKVVMDLMEK